MRRFVPFAVVVAVGCDWNDDPHRTIDPGMQGLAEVVDGNTTFAWDLHRGLAAEGGNLFVSPFSISSALGMTFAGARGATADEMRAALAVGVEDARWHEVMGLVTQDLNADRKAPYELAIGNRLWGQDGLAWKEPFLDTMDRDYGAPLEEADFDAEPEAVRGDINRWVDRTTDGNIPELLPPGSIRSDNALVLVNAIYFLGEWEEAFEEGATSDRPFATLDGGEVRVPTMARTGEMPYAAFDGYQVVELPYRGLDLALMLVVPDATDGLEELEATLGAADWAETIPRALAPAEVELWLPRFEMRYERELTGDLAELGMVSAFGAADFSGMTDDRALAIDFVQHQAWISVDEEGTEAAAATAVAMNERAAVVTSATVHADHPFLFAIRDRITGSLLFLGRLTDPR